MNRGFFCLEERFFCCYLSVSPVFLVKTTLLAQWILFPGLFSGEPDGILGFFLLPFGFLSFGFGPLCLLWLIAGICGWIWESVAFPS